MDQKQHSMSLKTTKKVFSEDIKEQTLILFESFGTLIKMYINVQTTNTKYSTMVKRRKVISLFVKMYI